MAPFEMWPSPMCHPRLSHLSLLFSALLHKIPAAVLMLLLECELRAKDFTMVAQLPTPVLLLPFQSLFYWAHQQLTQMRK